MMGNATYPNRNHVFAKDPLLGATLDYMQAAINAVALQTTASPVGLTSPPPQISALAVSAANGIFDMAISDNNPVLRGVNYFVEYSTTIGFQTPVVIDLGASRNYKTYLGNVTLYFRAYSSYPTSAPSVPVYFGAPTSVVGGGSAPPAALPSKGSGTAPDNGEDGGSGFGKELFRGNDPL